MNSVYFWWFLDIYRTTQVANRLHTWNAAPFVAFESIKQISTVHSLPVGHVCLFVCAKYFRFLTIAWSHIPGPTWSGGVGMGVGVCQKSVFHARAHFCQDIIPWDLFVYAIFCVAFPQLSFSSSCCCYFSFRFFSPSPLLWPPSQLFFIVANPEASRLVNCVQREGSLCVCRQFGASNH